MNSKRLFALAKNISLNDIVLDVGCDHGYLSMYLKQNNLCKEIYASDISINALNMAKKNFEKNNLDIQTYLSDGFQNIPVKFDTAVIAGMGTSTIVNILKSEKRPNKLVISSHNELYKLRKSIYEMGYTLVDEQVVFEKGHYYNILVFINKRDGLKQIFTEHELKFGISNNKEYYKFLYDKNKMIIKNVPFKKKLELIKENITLKGLIRKK